MEEVSNQRYQSCVNIFEEFEQEDLFAGAIITSLPDTGSVRHVIATGLICELKTYEVRYNSRGQRLTILIGAHSWSMRNDLDLDNDSALIFTKFYTKEQDLERTELLIQSPYLVSALQEVIIEYPGVNIQSRAIVMRDLPECIFHYRTELQRYGTLLVDLAPRRHLGLLFQHSFNVLKPHLDRYYSSMVFSDPPGLNFHDLWMAFRPGDLLCENNCGEINAMRLVSMQKSSKQQWLLTTLIASSDGSNFGYEQVHCEIQHYDGYMSLDQLPIFPLKYHSFSEELRAKLEQRGHKYVSLFAPQCRQYTGTAKMDESPASSTRPRRRNVYVSLPMTELTGLGSLNQR